MKRKFENTTGITLVALVVTIVVLLILAGITIVYVFGENGVFGKASEAKEKTAIAKAREKLEIVLSEAKIPKHTDPLYNENEFLNQYILDRIKNTEIKGNVAIVDGWAFELDRSVPKIGDSLGKGDDLVFPTIEIISGPTLSEGSENREAKFTVKATEETKGINKIELWLNGKIIDEYTETYETPQKEKTREFTVNRNGTYTVKVYADLMNSKAVKVEGIAPTVTFSPNENKTYKKEHTTQVVLERTAETVTEMKYAWVKDDNVNIPSDSVFTGDCLNNRKVTGQGANMTGTYYLWVKVKTATGTNYGTSGEFYFDNKGPEVTLTSTPTSDTSFTLTATASDNESGVAKYDFYIDGIKVDTQVTTEGTATYTWKGMEMAKNKNCYVIVSDGVKNQKKEIYENACTMLYTWEIYNVKNDNEYTIKYGDGERVEMKHSNYTGKNPVYSSVRADNESGRIVGVGNTKYLFNSNPTSSLSPGYEIKNSTTVWYWYESSTGVIGPDKGKEYMRRKVGKLELVKSTPSCGSSLKGIIQDTRFDAFKEGNDGNGSWYISKGVQ